MNKKNLLWLIPITLIIGFITGSFITSAGMGIIIQNYPIIDCIYNLDNALNINNNQMPFTIESQREVIQWRCAKEHINFNFTDYDEIFKFR